MPMSLSFQLNDGERTPVDTQPSQSQMVSIKVDTEWSVACVLINIIIKPCLISSLTLIE